MKISELQDMLEKYKIKYGDIEVKFYNMEKGKERIVMLQDFSISLHDDAYPAKMNNVSVWILEE